MEKSDFKKHFFERHQNSLRCLKCKQAFRNVESLRQHQKYRHGLGAGDDKEERVGAGDDMDEGPSNIVRPWEVPEDTEEPNVSQDKEEEENLDKDEKDYLKSFEDSFTESVRVYKGKVEVNTPVRSGTLERSRFKHLLRLAIDRLLKHLKGKSAKVNIRFGVVLRSRTTGAVRYFWPGLFTALLTESFKIEPNDHSSIAEFYRIVAGKDVMYRLVDLYKDSDWELLSIVFMNVVAYFKR